MSMLVNNTQIASIEASGLDQLHPDWNSLRLCSYCPGHAIVMCFVSRDGPQANFDHCPRTLLVEVLRKAGIAHGIQILTGFELEFFLMDAETQDCPIQNVGGWSTSAGLRGNALLVLEEIAHALEESGIVVRQYHTEGPRGQFEISLGPLEALESVDAYVYAREATNTICANHGIKATFCPKPLRDIYSLGEHVHISINPCNGEEHFLAGMLKRLPALCAFGMPSIDSYFRIRDYMNSAGTWVGWGTENKDVPVRKVDAGHWELRFTDGTANMYLTLAATIGAGLLGLQDGEELGWGDLREFPTSAGIERLSQLGMDTPMPTSIEEAILALGQDESMSEIVGKEMLVRYITVRKTETTRLLEMTAHERTLLYQDNF